MPVFVVAPWVPLKYVVSCVCVLMMLLRCSFSWKSGVVAWSFFVRRVMCMCCGVFIAGIDNWARLSIERVGEAMFCASRSW